MRVFPVGFLACALVAAFSAAPAWAAYDLSGAWHVRSPSWYVANHLTVTQAGGSLTYAFGAGSPRDGTIDEGTGAFVLDAFSRYPMCGTDSLTGSVDADSRSFTATYIAHDIAILGRFDIRCVTATYTLEGSRCGNGTLDVAEECDDDDRLDGDCCSSSCTLDAAGTACTNDYDVCTDDVCDGAGACLHPDNTAPCADAHGCGTGTCAGGSCAITSPEAAGTSCDLDASVCTVDQCDGAGSCTAGTTVDCAPCGTCSPSHGCVLDTTGCSPGYAKLAMSLGAGGGRVRASIMASEPAAEIGDPTLDTAYSLCVGVGGPPDGSKPTLLAATVEPAGTCDGKPCWTHAGSSFVYRNTKSSPSGITKGKIQVDEGSSSHWLNLSGRGELLGLPDEFAVAYPTLTLKMVSSNASRTRCWTNTIDDTNANRSIFYGTQSLQP